MCPSDSLLYNNTTEMKYEIPGGGFRGIVEEVVDPVSEEIVMVELDGKAR